MVWELAHFEETSNIWFVIHVLLTTSFNSVYYHTYSVYRVHLHT